MSNRYFTPRRQETLGAPEVPFSSDIDPHGFLQQATGNALFHGEENVVHYYEGVLDDTVDTGAEYK